MHRKDHTNHFGQIRIKLRYSYNFKVIKCWLMCSFYWLTRSCRARLKFYINWIRQNVCGYVREEGMDKGGGRRKSLLLLAACFTLLEDMNIWCKIQVMIYPLNFKFLITWSIVALTTQIQWNKFSIFIRLKVFSKENFLRFSKNFKHF